jgi:hypothetical protein
MQLSMALCLTSPLVNTSTNTLKYGQQFCIETQQYTWLTVLKFLQFNPFFPKTPQDEISGESYVKLHTSK